MKISEMKILVIGPFVWGRGDTLKEALEKAEKPRYYKAYIVHPDTCVNEMGDIEYPLDFAPKVIHEVLPRKKKAKK